MSFPGKLAVLRRPGKTGTLALGFTSEIISLYARDQDNWVEVAQAAVSAPDFADQIRALRAEATARDRTNAPVTLWLPAEQVIERHYTLAAVSEDARRTEATRRIAGETPHRMEELTVAIASDSRFEPVKVLAVLLQTMAEARSHAAAWGFVPGPVSTRVGTRGFAPPGPVFRFPRTAAGKAGRTVRQTAVAAVAMAAVGGAAFGAYKLVGPMLDSPSALGPDGPTPSSYSFFLDPPPGPQIPLGDVEKTVVTHLDLPRMRARAKTLAPSAGTASRAVLRKSDTPRTLEAPDSGGPLTVGNAPGVPKVGSIGRAAPSPVDMDKMVIAAIIPIAPISDLVGRSAPEPVTDNTTDDTTRPDPNQLRRTEVPAAVADGDTEIGTETETETAPPIVVAAAETPVKVTPVDATEFAPQKVAGLPRPRPGSESATTTTDSTATEGPVAEGPTPPKPRPAAIAAIAAPGAAETSEKTETTETAADTDAAPAPVSETTKTAAAETTDGAAAENNSTADSTAKDSTETGNDTAGGYVAMTSRFGPPPARPGSTPGGAGDAVARTAGADTDPGPDSAPEATTAVVTTPDADAPAADPATTETADAGDDDTATAAADATTSPETASTPTGYVAMTSRFGPPPARPGTTAGNTPAADETDNTDLAGAAETDTNADTVATTETTTETTTEKTAAETEDRTPAATTDADTTNTSTTDTAATDADTTGADTATTDAETTDTAAADTAATDIAGTDDAGRTESGEAKTAPAPYVAMTSRFGPPPARPGSALAGTATPDSAAPDNAPDEGAPVTADAAAGADTPDGETTAETMADTKPDVTAKTDTAASTTPETTADASETPAESGAADTSETPAETAETAPTYVAMTSRFGPPPLRPGTTVAAAPKSADVADPAPEGDATTATTDADDATKTPAPPAGSDDTAAEPTYVAMTSRFGPPRLRPAGSLAPTEPAAAKDADAAATDTALNLPAPRPDSLVKLPAATPPAEKAPVTPVTTAGTTAAPADPAPKRTATSAGIASEVIRTDPGPGASPDDGGSTAGVPLAALTVPTGRPADLTLSGVPERAETPVSPKDRERLALAPATTELRVKPDAGTTKAPEPSKRPRTLEIHARRAPARTRTPLSVYLPRSVGDAAKRTGLALNKTNLIGVIEAESGRQALVRLPDGGFRKVSQGDSIDGWRVSAVNRESVRLTRRGEKRTLLLVTP